MEDKGSRAYQLCSGFPCFVEISARRHRNAFSDPAPSFPTSDMALGGAIYDTAQARRFGTFPIVTVDADANACNRNVRLLTSY